MKNKKALLIIFISIIFLGIIGLLLLNLNNNATTSKDDAISIPQKIVNDEIESEKDNLENKVIDTSNSRLSECEKFEDKYVVPVVPEIKSAEGFGTFTGQQQPVNNRNECIRKIAVKEKDTPLCSSISDDEGRLRCLYTVSKEIAKEKDTSLCSSISDEEGRLWCLNEVYKEIAVDKDNPNPSLCDKLIGSKKSCIYESNYYVAQNSKNPDDCLNIEDTTDRDNCYRGLAAVTGDASICDRVSVRREYCISGAARGAIRVEAVEQGDYSICGQLSGSDVIFCYTSVAIELNDLTVCDNYFEIKEDSSAPYNDIDNCYYRLAEGLKDASICESMNYEPFAERCKDNVNN